MESERTNIPNNFELKQENKSAPFLIDEPDFNEETRRAIVEARNGIGLSRGFSSVEELFEALAADD